jgi:hypothetical protein
MGVVPDGGGRYWLRMRGRIIHGQPFGPGSIIEVLVDRGMGQAAG